MEEEKGISIGEVLKIIFKRVWWVLGATAAVTIAFVCIIQFWLNPENQTYSASYEISLPSGNENPDGTALNLEKSILLYNLQEIKSESLLPEENRTGRFASIDIEKMVREDGIKFSQVIEERGNGSYVYRNTVTIVKKYFKNKELAADFVRAVAQFPINKAKHIVESMNYTNALSKYDKYKTYEEKINALIEQKNYIVKAYERIAAVYGGNYVPAGLSYDNDINGYIRDLTAVLDERQQAALRNTYQAYYYEYDTSDKFISETKANIDSLEEKIRQNENVINELSAKAKEFISDGNLIMAEAFSERIAQYVEDNAKKRNEIDRLKKTLEQINIYSGDNADEDAKKAKDDYDASLQSLRVQLEECSKTLKKVTVATYEEKAQVIYGNNKITAEGGLSIVLAAVIGLIIGFVAVGAVILIIDYPKYKRAQLALQNEEGGDNVRNEDGQ